ncbi:hypothetical protein RFM26_08170 [Mesorhizobium sp. VK23B]|uniref:Uncharacterized protein n=1 Tax=Mesorhizobium dulcispinae TaxID=3072316 RepID=A0ABU4XAL3_9HYPH|nr:MULTISPECIES: hypothetical protein [unclassified Mesorhizobium]MDX8465655.1 hypothetical protein [Mesorhizobium sp. VK23B]MDX8471543.1 hypothetical protein [Mesorhizobium sp. VK23A]
MDSDLISMHFGAMLHCESRGDYFTMRAHLKGIGMELAEHADIETLRGFAKLLMRVIVAIDEEAERGPGSLLNRTHPSNVEWPRTKPVAPIFVTLDRIQQLEPVQNQ